MNTATFPAPNGQAHQVSTRVVAPTAPVIEPGRSETGTNPRPNGAPVMVKPPKGRRSMLKPIALTVLMAIVGIGAAKLASDWWMVGRFIESTDDAYIGGDVTVIAPEVPGFIAKLAVTDNQSVHAGDLLIKLDDRDYRAALGKAAAAVAIQEASLTNLMAQAHLQEAVIAQAQAEITATEAEIIRTRDDQGRYQKLSTTGAASIQAAELAATDYKQAVANGDKAQAALAAAQRQLEVIATQKLQAEAARQQSVAERDTAQLNLGYTELRAPIDGTVGNRSAQVGAYTTTGAQLISLVPAQGLWIDANFKESQLDRMQPGSPATVTVDSIPGKIFHGHVVSIAPATGAQFSVLPPENATGNFTKIVQRITVRIMLDNETGAAGELRPGLSVTARVDTRVAGKAHS